MLLDEYAGIKPDYTEHIVRKRQSYNEFCEEIPLKPHMTIRIPKIVCSLIKRNHIDLILIDLTQCRKKPVILLF